MTSLTETQRLVLQCAALRGDRILPLPHGMRRADYLGTSLVARNLALELYSEPGWPIWRRDPAKRPVSLRITLAGMAALADGNSRVQPVYAFHSDCPQRAVCKGSSLRRRIGQKQVLALRLLYERNGVTLNSLAHATGWQPHSARARLSGLRDAGYNIIRIKRSEHWVYCIDKSIEWSDQSLDGSERALLSDE